LCILLDLWEIKELESINNLLVVQVKDLKGKRNRNVRALGLIQKGVTDLIFPRVMRATQAKQAWENLQREYKGEIKVRVVKLQNLRK